MWVLGLIATCPSLTVANFKLCGIYGESEVQRLCKSNTVLRQLKVDGNAGFASEFGCGQVSDILASSSSGDWFAIRLWARKANSRRGSRNSLSNFTADLGRGSGRICQRSSKSQTNTIPAKSILFDTVGIGPTSVLTGLETDSHVRAWIALCDQGQLIEAVEALELLVQRGSYVDSSLLYHVLKMCMAQKNLLLGTRIHALAVKSGYESNKFLANHIIRMYAALGRLQEATQVFTRVAAPDSFMWFSIIQAHDRHGQPKQAIDLYRKMRESSAVPDNHVIGAVLKACASAGDLASGEQVHADIRRCRLEPDMFVSTCLVDMYAKCGRLENARDVFDSLESPHVVTWNAMMAGYVQHGLGHEALILYARMQQGGMTACDSVTFLCLLQACGSVGALQQGKELHSQIVQKGLESDLLVGSCLVDMYAKCESLGDARRVFDNLTTRNEVTWTAMIAGYAQKGMGRDALNLYTRMQHEGIVPADSVVFVCLLKACANIGALQQGKDLHSQVVQKGLEGNVLVGNCLVNMYAKCGSLEEARRVFDSLTTTRDVVTWNSMIAGYAQQGMGQDALMLYDEMRRDGVIAADRVTFVSLLQACGNMGALQRGKDLHSQIVQQGLDGDVVVGNCLVDMYAKCGSMEEAREVFDTLTTRDVVTWTSVIAGYVEHGMGPEALSLFGSMRQDDRASADSVMFVCLLQACACVGALQHGKELHDEIRQRGFGADPFVCSCLVDMYAKCGDLAEARKVLDSFPARDVVTWNALLGGYAHHTDSQGATKCFEDMRQQGVQPDHVSFVCLLVACSHDGLVEEGQQYFKMMVEEYGIEPTPEHYNCMVDLLGRSGCLDEAETMLKSAPFEADHVGWTSLLTACKCHGDLVRGRRCFDHLTELQPGHAAAYALMANMYATAGRWEDVERVEGSRKSAGAWKKPAKACIEVRKRVHEFTVGDERADISSKLKAVNSRLRQEGGHVPQTELVVKVISRQEKEDALCGHAEKLALAYGLMNTPEGTTLLVTKNLRMCADCHSSTKIMSSLEKREIVVRDARRVHRFVEGSCSCGDRH